MEFQNIKTVGELKNSLNHYPKTLLTTIFDENKGYISVAFRKETIERNGKITQFLCFYPHDKNVPYDTETLIAYLEKLPHQAVVVMKDSNNQYSPLFVSIDETIDTGNKYQWLVLSDRLSYERFFSRNELTITEQALEKMSKELEKEHSTTIDNIHNWLCQQTDESLFKGILKEDRTIEGSMKYCLEKAKQLANKENGIMLDDDTVYQWIKEYYLLEEIPKKENRSEVKGRMIYSKDKKTNHSEEKEVKEQISLF